MSELDLSRLREVAESATPGPWSAANEHALLGPDAHPAWCISRMQPGFETMTPVEGYMFDVAEVVHDDERTEADAEHIAAFDPPTVLALIERVERAESAVERVRGVLAVTAALRETGRYSAETNGWLSAIVLDVGAALSASQDDDGPEGQRGAASGREVVQDARGCDLAASEREDGPEGRRDSSTPERGAQ